MKTYFSWFILGAKTILGDMERCDLFKHASAMAYVMLLSIVPSLAAIFSLISVFSPLLGEEGGILLKVKELVLSNLAASSGEQVMGYIQNLIQNLNVAQIGITGLIGILVSLILLLRQIELALNRIWLVKKERNIFTRFIYFWTFVTLGTFILGLAFGALTGFNLKQYMPFDGEVVTIDKTFLQFLTPKLAIVAFFIMLYKVVPNTFVPFKHALIGAVPSALMFIIASNTYGTFTAKFTNYQAVYGALAAIPLFLMWLYILWLIILFGAVIAWRSQQGFTFKKEVSEEIKISPLERFRNHQLQSLTPLVTISLIYQKFSQANGEGATGQDIANETHLPTSWVLEALEILEDRKYVIRAKTADSVENDDALRARYFPTLPPSKLSVLSFAEGLSESMINWLEEWKLDQPEDIKNLVSTVTEIGKPAWPNKDFDRFLVDLSKA